ncbi:hypothetical protein [Chryseobacterium lathyri]|uniref:Uncharacterized protein n=1 Tax=Chryseobacterium lathyri TaxID=395933 RepID=A0ABT9STB0_9FLAO|nr:hypothetical protein [Chryseobacterium lathyri]MDP9961665.1 hypothetical protein [Chryseobacterium lathyri]
MTEDKNIFDSLHWQVEEKILKISENFRDVIFDIHKSDNEKVKELFVIYENTVKKDKNKDLLFIYNLKIELLKFLFEETRFYSDNNDSRLFSLFKSDILFTREQLFEFEFMSDLKNSYYDNIFIPQLQLQNYEILSKVQFWYSYNCTLIIEDLVLSSEFPSMTRQEITKFLKHKTVNLKDKILKEQKFLDWHLTLKNRYLGEIKEIEHTLIELDNLSLNDNNPLSKVLDFEKNIFRSLKAQNWFFSTLEEIGAVPSKRGFGTVISAIFRNKDCKENIFPDTITQKDYIHYLNSEFSLNMNSTNLSIPDKYEPKIKIIMDNYLSNKSE